MFLPLSFEKLKLFLGSGCPLHHGFLDVLVDGFGDFVVVGDNLLLLFGCSL